MLILIVQMWKQIHRGKGIFFCRDIMGCKQDLNAGVPNLKAMFFCSITLVGVNQASHVKLHCSSKQHSYLSGLQSPRLISHSYCVSCGLALALLCVLFIPEPSWNSRCAILWAERKYQWWNPMIDLKAFVLSRARY